jgi:phage shock protein PspC (stress-responsive transcriptional regulator)
VNEITKIHLGRQAFTIAIDAHKMLQAYLHAIERQVGQERDVLKEVELRMVELLAERGVTGDKVVLTEDVEHLKQQLGQPSDFKSDADDIDESKDKSAPKRLFRDTERGMIAGVAAGLAAYVGIDPLVVRLLFILLVFSGGAGILVYVVLWLLVPPARSGSDRLQMQGVAVTVDNIKQVVERADVPGAAGRASKVIGRFLERVAQLTLGVIGVGLAAAAVGLFLFGATAATYLLTHGLDAAGQILFPFGAKEVLWVVCGLAFMTVVAIALAVVGIALVRRKWQLPVWALAGLLTVFIASVSVGTALGFDTVPRFSQRYDSLQHVESRSVPEFKSLLMNGNIRQIEGSSDYQVEIRYIGNGDPSQVKTVVKDGVLSIDTSAFEAANHCQLICPYGPHNLVIVVHMPPSVGLLDELGSPPVENKFDPYTHLPAQP